MPKRERKNLVGFEKDDEGGYVPIFDVDDNLYTEQDVRKFMAERGISGQILVFRPVATIKATQQTSLKFEVER